MVASRFYRHVSKTFGVSVLIGALVSSCGNKEEKPDLGPKRQPRDNAAVANPPPPPKVDPLIPGFTIPAPRFRGPEGQDQSYYIHNSAPKQHDLVMAPEGTRTIDQTVAVLPTRLPHAGNRAPVKQFAPLPQEFAVSEAPTASEEAATLPVVPAMPPVQPGYQSQPIDPNHPALQPKKKEKKSFFAKLKGIFAPEKPEPKRMPHEQGHVMQGSVEAAVPTRMQGFSEKMMVEESAEQDVEVLQEGSIDAIVGDAVKEENVKDGQPVMAMPSKEEQENPVEREVTPAAWLGKEPDAAMPKMPEMLVLEDAPKMDMPEAEPVMHEQRMPKPVLDMVEEEKEDVLPPMEAIYEEYQTEMPQGKSIQELIEERRKQYYQKESFDSKESLSIEQLRTIPEEVVQPQKKPSSVNWEMDPDAKRLDDDALPWLGDETSSQTMPKPMSPEELVSENFDEAEILAEFDVDENGVLVDASDNAAGGNTVLSQQQDRENSGHEPVDIK